MIGQDVRLMFPRGELHEREGVRECEGQSTSASGACVMRQTLQGQSNASRLVPHVASTIPRVPRTTRDAGSDRQLLAAVQHRYFSRVRCFNCFYIFNLECVKKIVSLNQYTNTPIKF